MLLDVSVKFIVRVCYLPIESKTDVKSAKDEVKPWAQLQLNFYKICQSRRQAASVCLTPRVLHSEYVQYELRKNVQVSFTSTETHSSLKLINVSG